MRRCGNGRDSGVVQPWQSFGESARTAPSGEWRKMLDSVTAVVGTGRNRSAWSLQERPHLTLRRKALPVRPELAHICVHLHSLAILPATARESFLEYVELQIRSSIPRLNERIRPSVTPPMQLQNHGWRRRIAKIVTTTAKSSFNFDPRFFPGCRKRTASTPSVIQADAD